MDLLENRDQITQRKVLDLDQEAKSCSEHTKKAYLIASDYALELLKDREDRNKA